MDEADNHRCTRRTLLGGLLLGGSVPAVAAGCTRRASTRGAPATGTPKPSRTPLEVWRPDVLVVGGGVGGTAAALTVLRDHHTVVLTEPTSWVGGQLTSQGVPPDEHVWVEDGIGATATYRELRAQVRQHFVDHYPVTEHARTADRLDPGRSWAARLTAEPVIWHRVLRAALQPYEASERLRLLLHTRPVDATTASGRVTSVVFDTRAGRIEVRPTYVVDASELGELLPLTGTPYVVGRERGRGKGGTGEPNNRWHDADPRSQQAFTVVAALGHAAGHDGVPVRTGAYERYRASYRGFPSKLRVFDPTRDWSWADGHNYWQYRRARFHGYLTDAFLGDITLLNQRQNDHADDPLVPASGRIDRQGFDAAVRRAAGRTLGLVQYFQLEYPRPDGTGTGWGGLFPSPETLGTANGLAMHPYVRESRRLRAQVRITEQDVRGAPGQAGATTFPDAVGVGVGPIDVHVTRSHRRGLLLPTYPFQIPLRALLPRRATNLLAGAKNLGVTHLANGCYRYHPVEWSIGEAAGHACAFAIRQDRQLTDLTGRSSFREFAAYLDGLGIQRSWAEERARVEIRSFHST